jgi:trigger factor
VNVTVDHLAACKKLMRVELDVAEVDASFDKITREFQTRARLPGFRPGRTPVDLIARTFAKDIADRVKQELISDSFKKALKEQKLHVVAQPDVEEIEFQRGQPLKYAATLETAPEFELPEYKGLPVKIETRAVTEEDVAKALDALREQRADYKDVARPAQSGDFVVVNYTGMSEDKPITEIAPTAKGLASQQNFWMKVEHDQFIPGFTDQLIGANAGEKRTVTVDFPSDFVTPQLAGKKGVFEVEIVQVKERSLPELNEAFAKDYGADDVEQLREGVRRDLQNELAYKRNRVIRNQIIGLLMSQVNFELPESMVSNETRNVVYDIVRENTQRGLSKEEIDAKKGEIMNFANRSAQDRVKAGFLLSRIAQKENIAATKEEITNRILHLANQYQIKPEKFVRQLEEKNGIEEIREQIVTAKVLDFLQLHAKIEEGTAGPAGNPS